jgi:hypothetical protein
MKRHSLIVVEGPTDEAFVARILRKRLGLELNRKLQDLDPFWEKAVPKNFPHMGDLKKRVPVPSFYFNEQASVAIVCAGGQDRIPEEIFDHLDFLTNRDIPVGVLIDADNQSPATKAADMAARIANVGIDWPSGPAGSIDPTTVRGIFVFPDNQAKGTLEDLLLLCGDNDYQFGIVSAEQWVTSVAAVLPRSELKEYRAPAGHKKALLGAFGNVLRPGKSFAMSIEDNKWIDLEANDPPKLKLAVDFLRQIVLPSP